MACGPAWEAGSQGSASHDSGHEPPNMTWTFDAWPFTGIAKRSSAQVRSLITTIL